MAELALMSVDGRPAVARKALQELSAQLGENKSGRNWRLQALQDYANVALPDRVQHLWRYTDPTHLLPNGPLPAAMPSSDAFDGALPADGPAALLWPGQAPVLNDLARAAGVKVTPLLHDDGEAELLGSAAPADAGFFHALNAVAWNTGAAVYVPAGTVLAQPLRLLVPALAATTLPRLLVVAGRGAEATVVEEHFGGGADRRVIGVTELLLGENAHLRHVLVQRWTSGVHGFLAVQARLERNATYLGAIASLGGDRLKLETGADLAGPGARSELIGVVLGGGRQRFDHHTRHRHLSGDTWSNIDFKAALTEKARSSYTGLIRIEEHAARSQAFQENRNLLLSDDARADTIPELEILTDDVSCSHGATAAPIDPEQIFYLQSRGIPRREAVQLVLRGFLEPTLAQVPASVRDSLEALVADRLAGLGEDV